MPKLRNLPRRLIEDFEPYFTKEVVTQGYQLQQIEEQGDYLHFVYRGICKIIYPVDKLPLIFGEGAFYDKEKQQYLVMGHLERGAMFGQQSALNDLPHPFTVVAATPKVEVYKILRT